MEPDRIKHLEMLQAVITRMAQNCFQLKGWGVVVVAGLLALGGKEMERTMIYVAYVPVFFFALLDAAYLTYEQNFRTLYDLVRDGDQRVKPFALRLPDGVTRSHMFNALASWSVWGFWVPIAVAIWIASRILLG